MFLFFLVPLKEPQDKTGGVDKKLPGIPPSQIQNGPTPVFPPLQNQPEGPERPGK